MPDQLIHVHAAPVIELRQSSAVIAQSPSQSMTQSGQWPHTSHPMRGALYPLHRPFRYSFGRIGCFLRFAVAFVLFLAGALFSFSASSKGPPAPEFASNFRNARLTQAFLGTINGDRRSTLPRNSPPPPGRFARWRRDGQKQRASHCRAALIRLGIDPAKYRGTYRYTPGTATGRGGQIVENGIEAGLQPVAQKMQREDRATDTSPATRPGCSHTTSELNATVLLRLPGSIRAGDASRRMEKGGTLPYRPQPSFGSVPPDGGKDRYLRWLSCRPRRTDSWKPC